MTQALPKPLALDRNYCVFLLSNVYLLVCCVYVLIAKVMQCVVFSSLIKMEGGDNKAALSK